MVKLLDRLKEKVVPIYSFVQKKIYQKNIRLVALVAAVFVVLLLLGNFGFQDSNYKNEWQLFKKPEEAAELYFTHHTALPKKYTPGSSETVSFTVRLYDLPTGQYDYEVAQEDPLDGKVIPLKSGQIEIGDGQSFTEDVTVTYSDAGSRSKILVHMPQLDQTIHYWVERQ